MEVGTFYFPNADWPLMGSMALIGGLGGLGGLAGFSPGVLRAQESTPVEASSSGPADDETTELQEIVVESTSEPLTERPLGIGISGRTLKETAGSVGDPLRTLQALPGLVFANDESAAPAVRGSRPGDNIFQVDFVPTGYLFHSGGIVSVFNADLVDSFDIHAAAYGPEFFGATGGVFDVKLRDPAEDQIRGSVDISLLQAGVLVEGSISDNQSFYLAGRRSYLELLLKDRIEEDGVTIDEAQVFLKDQWSVTDRLTLYPGFSAHTEDLTDKSFLEPRFALEYEAADDLVWSAGLGLYHQSPGFAQVNEVLGNPDLDPIRSVHAVVGVEKGFEKDWSVKTELYYKDLDSLVAGDEQLRFNNSGKGEAFGMDVLIRKDLTHKWSGWVSLSLSKARREQAATGDEFVFDFDQPFNASLVASYKASEKWRFGAKFWTHSGAPYTPVIGADPDAENPGFFIPQYGPINSERLPSFQRIDLRADRTFFRREQREVTGYLEVMNVLNSDNPAGFDYDREYGESEQTTQLPRNLFVGMKASF